MDTLRTVNEWEKRRHGSVKMQMEIMLNTSALTPCITSSSLETLYVDRNRV